MKHIREMREFVRTVDLVQKNPSDDPIENYAIIVTRETEGAERSQCIEKFNASYHGMNLADEICESAIANGYLHTQNLNHQQYLAVNPLKGRDLLTQSGYLRELCSSINPVLSVSTSLIALVVSVIALMK